MDGAVTSQLTISPKALEDNLSSGDAVINFSFDTLTCDAQFVSFAENGQALLSFGAATPVGQTADSAALVSLLSDDVRRFVVVSDGGTAAVKFASSLAAAGIAHKLLLLAEDCNADAFMDEEDSEAVAERLRQLGYI